MKTIQIILLILIILGLGLLATQKYWVDGVVSFIIKINPKITNFDECVNAGNPVMESYPRQCRANGENFVEIINEIQPPIDTGTGGNGGGAGILPYDSGVEGTVTLGPSCPVMREPPDPNCADKPFETTIQIIAVGSPKSSPFATVKSGKDGKFKIMLPPGKYALQPVGGSVMPRCGTQEVTLVPAKVLKVDLYCDTGIR